MRSITFTQRVWRAGGAGRHRSPGRAQPGVRLGGDGSPQRAGLLTASGAAISCPPHASVLDAGAPEQVRQHQPGWPGADDRDLRGFRVFGQFTMPRAVDPWNSTKNL
jgi:hypothetical protein